MPPPRSPSTSASGASDPGLMLLLVEDNPGDADLAFEILAELESAGVRHVGGLREATDALERERYAVVLLDLNLPESRGLDTVLRARQIVGDTPIIVLSGLSDARIRDEALESGVADFLVKGDSLPALLTRSVLYAVHRRRAEAAHERLSKLVFALPDAVLVLGTDGRVRFANPAAVSLFGCEQSSLVGLLPPFAIPSDGVGVVGVQGAEGLRTVEVRGVELDWDGTVAHLAVLRDITEQRRIESQLREASKLEAVGQLAAGVAHDFNNLLMVIMTYGGFVRDALGPDDPRRADLVQVLRAADTAAGLTKQLMTFSRRSAGELRVVDAGQLVHRVAQVMAPALGAGIDVRVVADAGVWPMQVDEVLVEQVLINLAVNARDAMPQGGQLWFEVRNHHGQLEGCTGSEFVEIAVVDSGHGMPEEVARRAFEPFFTTKEPGKGTGLGLAVSYGTIRQFGGQIRIESAPGRGTAVHLWIPRCEAALAGWTPGPTPRARAEASESVVVVEDDVAVRTLMVRVLRSEGYRVTEFARADDALNWIRSTPAAPALLLTDLVLPGGGGRILIADALARWPGVQVVVVSGTVPSPVDRELLGTEVRVVEKPVDLETLLDVVRATLDGRSTARRPH